MTPGGGAVRSSAAARIGLSPSVARSLTPCPSVGGGAHRPRTTACPPSPPPSLRPLPFPSEGVPTEPPDCPCLTAPRRVHAEEGNGPRRGPGASRQTPQTGGRGGGGGGEFHYFTVDNGPALPHPQKKQVTTESVLERCVSYAILAELRHMPSSGGLSCASTKACARRGAETGLSGGLGEGGWRVRTGGGKGGGGFMAVEGAAGEGGGGGLAATVICTWGLRCCATRWVPGSPLTTQPTPTAAGSPATASEARRLTSNGRRLSAPQNYMVR